MGSNSRYALLASPIFGRQNSLHKSGIALVASFQGVPPQRQAAFVLPEAFLLNHAAHVGRQAFEQVPVVGFVELPSRLLLVAIAGIVQPKQMAMIGPALPVMPLKIPFTCYKRSLIERKDRRLRVNRTLLI